MTADGVFPPGGAAAEAAAASDLGRALLDRNSALIEYVPKSSTSIRESKCSEPRCMPPRSSLHDEGAVVCRTLLGSCLREAVLTI